MTIQLNGDRRDVPGPIAVAGLLTDLGIDLRLVAVELNRVVIKRPAYVETMIQDGDEVEIVAFVGGG